MGLLDRILKKPSVEMQEQNFKHNVYESEISQYSYLPRFYYIEGKKYDIDSPESVSNIPICQTKFKINDEVWGIDTILREHVNRHYSHIPDSLKEACYPKISEFEWSEYKTESSAEKTAKLKKREACAEKERKLKSISLDDMRQFKLRFKLQSPFYYNQISIALVAECDKDQIVNDLLTLNEYVSESCSIAKLEHVLILPTNELMWDYQKIDVGTQYERTQYYTYFQYEPYTKTGKFSKYPLILHYATKNITEFSPEKNYFGSVYYMQDGSVGKGTLIFHVKSIIYIIELFRKGSTLAIKKIERSENGIKDTIYKD